MGTSIIDGDCSGGMDSELVKHQSALQNPLYQAMKELGKLLRTIFILRYMDDETMRQRIHQQQEKVESAHALSRVICYGNHGVLQYANHEELLTLQGCKRLIENIVYPRFRA
jgi:TnpA family transposase